MGSEMCIRDRSDYQGAAGEGMLKAPGIGAVMETVLRTGIYHAHLQT